MSNAGLDAATAKGARNPNILYGRGVMLTAIGIIQGKICFVRIMTHEFQNTGHVNIGQSREAAATVQFGPKAGLASIAFNGSFVRMTGLYAERSECRHTVIQALARHKDISTTQRYIDYNDSKLRNAIELA